MDYRHEIINDDSLTQLHFLCVGHSAEMVLPHWHNHLEVLYLMDGEMNASINENSFTMIFFKEKLSLTLVMVMLKWLLHSNVFWERT